MTVCAHCVLSEVRDGEVLRSPSGDAVLDCWNALPEHYANLTLDAFVVMPNHVHGILILM